MSRENTKRKKRTELNTLNLCTIVTIHLKIANVEFNFGMKDTRKKIFYKFNKMLYMMTLLLGRIVCVLRVCASNL